MVDAVFGLSRNDDQLSRPSGNGFAETCSGKGIQLGRKDYSYIVMALRRLMLSVISQWEDL
jgi:hypothetical protein